MVTRCLDFWCLGVAVHNVLFHCIEFALCENWETMPTEAQFMAILDALDPEVANESTQGYSALRGVRIRRMVDLLRHQHTLPRLFLLVVVLAPVRWVNKFYNASVRSVRVRARAHGHAGRPPIWDLSSEARSPALVAMQYCSSLLWSADGPALPLVDIFRGMCSRSSDPNLLCDILSALRAAAVSVHIEMEERHDERFKRWPWRIAQTLGEDQPLSVRIDAQDEFFSTGECCLGFTATDLRRGGV